MSGPYVYFMRPVGGEGPIKIGHSLRPHDRLREGNKWSPVPLEIVATIPGGLDLEARFHASLSDHHSHNEWFHPTPDVLAVLAAVRDGTFDVDLLPTEGKLASPSPGNNRDGGIAGAYTGRLRKLEARGVRIPATVMQATFTYGLSPEDKAHNRAIVREFVEANWPPPGGTA